MSHSPSTATALTGRCSYLVFNAVGEYLYDPDNKKAGYIADAAKVYLWEPSEVAARIVELEHQLPWAGQLSARRARP